MTGSVLKGKRIVINAIQWGWHIHILALWSPFKGGKARNKLYKSERRERDFLNTVQNSQEFWNYISDTYYITFVMLPLSLKPTICKMKFILVLQKEKKRKYKKKGLILFLKELQWNIHLFPFDLCSLIFCSAIVKRNTQNSCQGLDPQPIQQHQLSFYRAVILSPHPKLSCVSVQH